MVKFIDKTILPNQIHYFLIFAGISPMFMFLSTFAKQLGFSSSAVGFTFSSMSILVVIGTVMFGIIADKFRILKLILVFCLVGCTTSSTLLPFLRKIDKNLMKTSLSCQLDGTQISFFDQQEDRNGRSFRKTCLIDVDYNENFPKICSSWKEAASMNEMDYSKFDCDQVKIEIEFFQSSDQENISQHGKIYKATSDMEIFLPHCIKNQNISCSVDCSEKLSFTEEILQPSFIYFFILSNCFSVCYGIILSFSDTMFYNLKPNEPHLYGRTRVFGSFSDGLACVLAGFLIDFFSDANSFEKNYTPMFILCTLSFTLDILCAKFLKAHQDEKNNFKFKEVSKLFTKFDVIIFTFWAFLVGFYQQLAWQFVFWYLEEISSADEATWLKTLQGLYELSTTLAGDVIAFYTFGLLVKKLGIKNCMTLVLLLNVLRFYTLSILQRPIWVLPIGCVDGFAYGLQYALITSYCDSISAPGTKTTVQAIFACIFDGIGTSVGGLCGGLLYSYYGGLMTFRIYAYISLGSFGLHILARFVSTFIQDCRI